jgi:hypothetical protein
MNKDPEGGGLEKDGTKSNKYCSYCYGEGQFLNDTIKTPKEMQKFCIEKMKEQGTPKILGWLLTRSIPKLQRWTD